MHSVRLAPYKNISLYYFAVHCIFSASQLIRTHIDSSGQIWFILPWCCCCRILIAAEKHFRKHCVVLLILIFLILQTYSHPSDNNQFQDPKHLENINLLQKWVVKSNVPFFAIYNCSSVYSVYCRLIICMRKYDLSHTLLGFWTISRHKLTHK